MSRAVVVAVVSVLLVPAVAGAKSPRACKRLHGHAKQVCLHKRKTAVPKSQPIPVTTTLLDGSTLTTSAGTFGITGAIEGAIPGQIFLNTPTTVGITSATFAPAAGAPCSSVVLAPLPALWTIPSGSMFLDASGVVFASLELVLPDCGGPTTLLLAGKVGDAGLNALTLDSPPGALTAHLVVKVDLSG